MDIFQMHGGGGKRDLVMLSEGEDEKNNQK